ncbi:MAG: GNAT family N-acetyltransferase [Ruminococcaceae bacterium]|nr:GNAT family N-acetyltransferase [Oscillospiraceae bacterium]
MKKETIYDIFSHIPSLETERLLLRALRVSDAADMFDYAKRPEVTRYLLWNPHPDIKHTKRYLEYLATRYRVGMFYDWALIHKKEKRMIGTCGFVRFDYPHNSAEIGYVLNPDYHGQGLMPEAANAVLAFGFSTLKLHRIEARFMIENTPSRHVMEKLGMTFEGVKRHAMLVKGSYRDIGSCAILENEFKKA